MKLIDRPIYTNQIRKYIDTNLIKVLTGQRRVGKSYILKLITDEIRNNKDNFNIIDINIEDFAFSHIKDAQSLHADIQSRMSNEKKNYIFIDEIQEIDGFDKVIRSLALSPNNDIYVTGSNSEMLSSEIASRLAGRSVEVRVHPLSYSEFLEFHSTEDSEDAIMMYLRYGGMPYLRNLPDKETWMEYLTGITDAIVYRDVISRHALRNADFLERLLLYLAGNIGQLFTAKRISDYIKSQGITATVGSVQSYATHLQDAYIVNKSRRWDVEGKRFFEIGEKYYFEDIGIRNGINGFRAEDLGGIMENVVYNHLKIAGYDVKTGVIGGDKEIDFIAERSGERVYIQVALTILNEQTMKREFGNLAQISDNYEKIVVTLHDSFPNTNNGIKTLSLREFLTTII